MLFQFKTFRIKKKSGMIERIRIRLNIEHIYNSLIRKMFTDFS